MILYRIVLRNTLNPERHTGGVSSAGRTSGRGAKVAGYSQFKQHLLNYLTSTFNVLNYTYNVQ